MTMIRWVRWTAAAAALAVAACAPVPAPSNPNAGGPPEPAADAEQLAVLPAPEPAGARSRIQTAIDQVRRRDLLTTNGFWTVFHGILGLGPSVTLREPGTGVRINAVDYICGGGAIRGMEFTPTPHGLDVRSGPQFVGQGHQDQFVAEMAQWGMPPDRPFRVYGKDYTFLDFVRHTQMRARVTAGQELDWAVLVIGQYFGTDAAWTNAAGERLRLEDLVRYELDQPMDTAACGGTHRLFGLSWVYHLHRRRGGPAEGVWREVAERTARYRELAQRYQNPDGSFSTSFFRSPGNAADGQLRINTTGHILEWLALSLSDDELREPWVENAASALALLILDQRDAAVEGGSLYHAVHGLLLYRARAYDAGALGPKGLPVPLPPGARGS